MIMDSVLGKQATYGSMNLTTWKAAASSTGGREPRGGSKPWRRQQTLEMVLSSKSFASFGNKLYGYQGRVEDDIVVGLAMAKSAATFTEWQCIVLIELCCQFWLAQPPSH